jgi:hypothetical protein
MRWMTAAVTSVIGEKVEVSLLKLFLASRILVKIKLPLSTSGRLVSFW